MTEQNKKFDPNQTVQIKASELPAYCPTEQMGLWNSHPRVYIPLEENRQANCPYCGTHFELTDDK